MIGTTDDSRGMIVGDAAVECVVVDSAPCGAELTLEELAGDDPLMLHNVHCAYRIADTDIPVLIQGPTGCGKEAFARAIHRVSRRAARPFVAVNCAAIPETLIESELFGYRSGAFTGARREGLRGRIAQSSGGTLFLDEIGDMPLPLQAKLLRFLQERVIERVGGRELIQVDVRVIAATHRDLKAAIAEKTFRDDLFYRISEVAVNIPPLRERGADAVLIANYLLLEACKRHGKAQMKLAPDALSAIERYAWPGNVRELGNRVNAAAIMAEGAMITAADLALEPAAGDAAMLSLREVRQRAESAAVERALALAGGNISKAAELLGVTRPTLYDLMERISIAGRTSR